MVASAREDRCCFDEAFVLLVDGVADDGAVDGVTVDGVTVDDRFLPAPDLFCFILLMIRLLRLVMMLERWRRRKSPMVRMKSNDHF